MSDASESLEEAEVSHHEHGLKIAQRGSIVNETKGSLFLVRKPTQKRLAPEKFSKRSKNLNYLNFPRGSVDTDNFQSLTSHSIPQSLGDHPDDDDLSHKLSFSILGDKRPSNFLVDRTSIHETIGIPIKKSAYKNSHPINSESLNLEEIKFEEQKTPIEKPKRKKKSLSSKISCFSSVEKMPHNDLLSQSIDHKYLQTINDKSVYTQVSTKSKIKSSEQKLRGLLKKHAIKNKKIFNITEVTKRARAEQSRPFIIKLVFRAKDYLIKLPKSLYREIIKTAKPLDPHSLFISIWNGIIMLFIAYLLVTIPLDMAFDIETDNVLLFIEWIENFFFALDMLLSFHTCYYREGIIITSHKLIAHNYLRSWFVIDFISCIPLELLFHYEIIDNTTGLATVFKLLRALKIIRVSKFFKIGAFSKFKNTINLSGEISGVMRLLKLCLTIIFLAHWCACFWHLIGSYLIDTGMVTWVLKYDLDDLSNTQRYVKSLYWACATLLTIGYGDIVSTNLPEQVYTILIMLLGCGVTGYSMNQIGEILQQINSEVNYKEKKMDALRTFLDKNQIDSGLQIKAKQYLEFKIEHERVVRKSDKTVLSSLSQSLHDQILRQINGRVMKNSELFQKSFGSTFLTKLAMMLQEQLLGPEELIFKEGDIQDSSLYFISRGKLQTFIEKYKVSLQVHEKGSYVGELSFFTNRPREVSAKTLSFCSVFCLPYKQFIEELEYYPADKEMYYMLKDQINILGDYASIYKKCELCQSPDHITKSCHQVHFVLDHKIVIQKYLKKQKSQEQAFIRRERTKFHALKNLDILNKVTKRLQTGGGTRNTRLISFTETEISLEGTRKAKKSTIMFNEEFDEGPENAFHSAAQTLEKALTGERETDELVKNFFRSRKSTGKSTGKESTDKYTRSLTIKYKGESIFIPSQAIEISEKYQRPAEELVIDEIKNYEIYFPHNNASKILEQIELQKQNKKGPRSVLLKPQDTVQFKMRLGKIFDKTKKKTKGSDQSLKDTPPVSRRKSMFYKNNTSPRLVRMRSKSITKEMMSLKSEQENFST